MRSSAMITGPDPRSVVCSFRLVGLPGWNWQLRPWRRTASRHEQARQATKSPVLPCSQGPSLPLGLLSLPAPCSEQQAACDLDSSTRRVEPSTTAVPPALFQCGQKPLYRYKMELPTYSAEVSWPILHWHSPPAAYAQASRQRPKGTGRFCSVMGDESHNVWLRRTEFQAFLRSFGRRERERKPPPPAPGGGGSRRVWRGTNAYATPAKYGGIVVPEARLESRPRHRTWGQAGKGWLGWLTTQDGRCRARFGETSVS
ncbi:hypothetical protein B0T11DRAFT_128407 [Plectosphaerella cucumerina]|uniref:Uncharacterized protein n=1 Tax=Plectosphaerella cucumerina TaxID=40658 RepID=A0A8K0TFE4_9PEZI|nr:hypothetical protein B0T11DRAFT_128407 [Plectosphaerella cucumerina]